MLHRYGVHTAVLRRRREVLVSIPNNLVYNTRQGLGGVGPQLVHVLGKHSLVFFLAGQGAKYNRTIREYFESVDCYILY